MKRRLDHSLPSWVTTEPSFFITVCGEPRGVNQFCKSPEGTVVLSSVRKYHDDQKWFCWVVLLMPDHAHLIITLSPDCDLTKTIRAWKQWLAREAAISWQKNFFDHRIRDERSEDEKGRYILANPVRAGFVERAEDWPWMWMPSEA